jgi:hypothetical protein
MTLKIEKGVRIPDLPRRGRRALYPFKEMKIGDSFQVPLLDEVKVRSAVTWFARRNKVHFRVFKMKDHIRVWKVKADA